MATTTTIENQPKGATAYGASYVSCKDTGSVYVSLKFQPRTTTVVMQDRDQSETNLAFRTDQAGVAMLALTLERLAAEIRRDFAAGGTK